MSSRWKQNGFHGKKNYTVNKAAQAWVQGQSKRNKQPRNKLLLCIPLEMLGVLYKARLAGFSQGEPVWPQGLVPSLWNIPLEGQVPGQPPRKVLAICLIDVRNVVSFYKHPCEKVFFFPFFSFGWQIAC